MQVGDREAKSTTHEETQDIIKLWWPKAKADLKKKGYKARLSMDNISIQQAASSCGLHRGDRIHLPPYSPDMHKVVEHAIGNLKREVYNRLYQEHYLLTSQQVQQIVRDIFYCRDPDPKTAAALKKDYIDSIRKDSDDLHYTYKVISMEQGTEWLGEDKQIHRGVGGNWPPARYR